MNKYLTAEQFAERSSALHESARRAHAEAKARRRRRLSAAQKKRARVERLHLVESFADFDYSA